MRCSHAAAFLAALFLASLHTYAQYAGSDPVPAVETLKTWNQCREYLPSKNSPQCRIDFDMAQTKDVRIPPQTHKDITVYLSPGSRGVVVLWRSSPFAACSLTTTPGPLVRDLSPNVSSALTSIGTGGAMPGVPAAITAPNIVALSSIAAPELTTDETNAIRSQNENRYQQFLQSLKSENLPRREREERAKQEQSQKEKDIEKQIEETREQKAKAKRDKIAADERTINDVIRQFQRQQKLYDALGPDKADYQDIRTNYLYSYSNNDDANNKLDAIKKAAVDFLSRPLPDNKTIPGMEDTVDKLQSLVATLRDTYGSDVDVFVNQATDEIRQARLVIANVKGTETVEALSYFNDATAKVQKVLDFIKDFQTLAPNLIWPDKSVQVLPIAVYSESKVAVTVKCADAVSSTPLFDNIQFNAYFQSPPVFDISAGALISTLHGRQAATQTPYGNPATTSCPATAMTTANCPVVIINVTRPQFVPGVFVDWHPLNFKLPGVHDPAIKKSDPPKSINTWMSEKAPRHPFGYVGSLGLAAGFLVNPNNGTVQAEFFEGISFGIQRFVFLVGNHTGRSQNLTGGYYVGEQVSTGSMPTTVRNWSNALAFGITYRVPLR